MLIPVEYWHVRCGYWWRVPAARCLPGTLQSAQHWRPARTLASPRTPSQRYTAWTIPSLSHPCLALLPLLHTCHVLGEQQLSTSPPFQPLPFPCQQDSRLLSVGPTAGSGVARPARLPRNERVNVSSSERRAVQDMVNQRNAATTWGDSLSGLQWCVQEISVFEGLQVYCAASMLPAPQHSFSCPLCCSPCCPPCCDWALAQLVQTCDALWLWRAGTWSR